MDQIRLRRLEELLREEISLLLVRGEIKDPRVGSFVSVSRVEASRDGGYAHVWISTFQDDGNALEQAVEGMKSASGFIQAQIARKVRLRLTPILRFEADTGIRYGLAMTEIIKDLTKE